MAYKALRGFVIVTGIPGGDAPCWVREAWKGLRLPIVGLENGKYHVPTIEACGILKGSSPAAALHWKAKRLPHKNKTFEFEEVVVRVDGTLEEVPQTCHQWLGLEEVGVGAHDANP